jgi:hypothetical protein
MHYALGTYAHLLLIWICTHLFAGSQTFKGLVLVYNIGSQNIMKVSKIYPKKLPIFFASSTMKTTSSLMVFK